MKHLCAGLPLLFLTFAADAGPAGGKVLELEPLERETHGTWIPVTGPKVPPSSGSVTTAYDAAQDRLLLLRDGWEIWVFPLGPGGRWERLPASGEPPDVVQSFSVVHDPGGSRLLVFGGITSGALRSNTVWELSLAEGPRWSRLDPMGTPPPARSDHGAIYDPINRRMIIVGGRGQFYSWWNDIWALELAGAPQWRAVTTSGPLPSMESGARAAYDPQRQRMIVTFFQQNFFMKAWALSLEGDPQWSDLSPVGDGPIAIPYDWSLCSDSARERLLVISSQGNSGFHNGIWELSLTGTPAWRALASGGLPLIGGFSHSGAFDSARDRLILQNGYRSETWAFGSDRLWHQLAGPPRGRGGHASVYDPLRRRMLLMSGQSAQYFAGFGFVEYDGRIWDLSLDDLQWTLTDGNSPSLEQYGAVLDPLGDRVIGIGGMSLHEPGCHPPYDQLVPAYSSIPWAIPLSGGSSGQVPEGPDVQGHSVVLDTRRNRVLVFGGVTISWYCDHNAQLQWAYNNRLRILSLSNPVGWNEVPTPEYGPAPRAYHAAVYDEDRDRVWIWGGTGSGDELWQLDPADGFTWTRVMAQGEAPPATAGHSMIYDPVRERLVVFGGNLPPSGLSTPWALSLAGTPRWERLAPAGEAPPGRSGHSAIYDPVNDQMVIFGGDYRNDTWVLRWGDPLLRVTIDVRPGDSRNTISPNAHGILPVAILGAAGFDAPLVDLRTVTVSGASPVRDGNNRFVSSTTDVNGDGSPDLTFHVRTESLHFDAENLRLRLDGRTSDGKRIRGTDSIRLVRDYQVRLSSEPPAGPALGLRHAGMHPAAGRLAGPILATLPLAEPGILEVFSITGRRIHSRTLEPGTHRLDLGAMGPLMPGVYALRLMQAGQSAHLRMVVLDH